MAALGLGSEIFIHLVEFGLNSAFTVLLHTQNFLHQGSLVGLVEHVRVVAWRLAGL